MTGRELVELAGRLQGLSERDGRTRATTTLELVGLADAARRRVGGYSGGMRQRLGIAQALVASPRLLILDEPVSSLDPEGRRDLLALIADLRASATVIFSTHVLADVERICDRVGIMDRGRLVTEGPLDELLARYALPIYRIEAEPGQADALARAGRDAARDRLGRWRDRRRSRAAWSCRSPTRARRRPGCCRWSWRPACAWRSSNGPGRPSRTSSCGSSARSGRGRRGTTGAAA